MNNEIDNIKTWNKDKEQFLAMGSTLHHDDWSEWYRNIHVSNNFLGKHNIFCSSVIPRQ